MKKVLFSWFQLSCWFLLITLTTWIYIINQFELISWFKQIFFKINTTLFFQLLKLKKIKWSYFLELLLKVKIWLLSFIFQHFLFPSKNIWRIHLKLDLFFCPPMSSRREDKGDKRRTNHPKEDILPKGGQLACMIFWWNHISKGHLMYSLRT